MLVALGFLVVAGFASGAPGDRLEVRVAATDHSSELIKTVPIAKRPGAKPKVLLSLDANRLGELRSGDLLEASGDAQFSVCLKPNSNHGNARDDCVGRVYGYNPRIDAYLALAPSADAAKRSQVTPVTGRTSQVCTQDQPDRNHHCVISVPWEGQDVDSLKSRAGCLPGACRLNLIVSSWDKAARKGDNVIVGGIKEGRTIEFKGKAKVSAAVFRPGSAPRPNPVTATKARNGKLSIVDDGKKPKLDVVYSVPLDKLRAGEALKIEGRYASSLAQVPYNVRTRTQVIFADGPTTTKSVGGSKAAVVADSPTAITEQNNFNCTQGKSGHRDPCPIIRSGVLRIRNSTKETLYINLIAAHGALINEDDQRWRGSDKVAVPKRGGYLKVWRFG